MPPPEPLFRNPLVTALRGYYPAYMDLRPRYSNSKIEELTLFWAEHLLSHEMACESKVTLLTSWELAWLQRAGFTFEPVAEFQDPRGKHKIVRLHWPAHTLQNEYRPHHYRRLVQDWE